MDAIDSPAVLFIDLPPAALAGIDLLSFTATPKFRGIKNLPPGFHLAFVGSSTAFSERHGIWFEIPSTPKGSPQPLVVTKWDASMETLGLVNDEAEILRWRANLGSIWREGLAPYRQQATRPDSNNVTTTEETNDWPALVSSLSPALLARITATNAASLSSWHLSSASSAKPDLEAIPGLSASDLNHPETLELHFLPIDLKQTWRDGATGRERSEAAQDRSWYLEHLIHSHCASADEKELVGELQLCFLTLLTLNNFSCLEQWKRLLSLLFTCNAIVPKRPDLFVSTIATLHLQLQHLKDADDAENGLIDLSDSDGNLLKTLLVRFRKSLSTLTQSGNVTDKMQVSDVLDELEDLESYLSAEHGWQLGASNSFAKTGTLELMDGEQVRMDTTAFDEEDETGEFAPQVVELSAEQVRELGVEKGEVPLTDRLTGTTLDDKERGLEEVDAGGESSEASEAGESSGGEEVEDIDLDDMDARY